MYPGYIFFVKHVAKYLCYLVSLVFTQYFYCAFNNINNIIINKQYNLIYIIKT